MANNLVTAENTRKQFIVVKIGSEQYGIDISYVDNIVRMQNYHFEAGRARCAWNCGG